MFSSLFIFLYRTVLFKPTSTRETGGFEAHSVAPTRLRLLEKVPRSRKIPPKKIKRDFPEVIDKVIDKVFILIFNFPMFVK